MNYPATLVWSLACAAQRMNGGYHKENIYEPAEDGTPKLITEANKVMVKRWLRENQNPAIESDTAAGEECRNYFKGLLLRQIAGKITDFEATALRIAQKDEFTGRDLYDFAVISCLPSAMQRDQKKLQLKRSLIASEPLKDAVGSTVVGDIDVIHCYHNDMYGRWRVTARMGEHFVDFWFGSQVQGSLRIRGKVKEKRADKTTQLSHVKTMS